MLVIGLTGSIGMGKSAVSKMLRGMGYPVHSADEAVHKALMKGGPAFLRVAKLFPECVRKGKMDKAALGKIVFGNPKKLKQLERILHPFVWKSEKEFIKQARKKKFSAAILEIPLLFETGADKRCDIVLCVNAPRAVQKARVLARKGMTEALFRAILAKQMPNAEKCKRADYVIPTGGSLRGTGAYIKKIFAKICKS